MSSARHGDDNIYYRLPDGLTLYRCEIEECFMHVHVTEDWRKDNVNRENLDPWKLDLFERMPIEGLPLKRFVDHSNIGGVTVERGWAWVITDVWSSFLHSELTLQYANRFKHKFSGPWLTKGVHLERPLHIREMLRFEATYAEHENHADTASVVLRGFFARAS